MRGRFNHFIQLHNFKTTIIDFWKFEHLWKSKARPTPSSRVASPQSFSLYIKRSILMDWPFKHWISKTSIFECPVFGSLLWYFIFFLLCLNRACFKRIHWEMNWSVLLMVEFWKKNWLSDQIETGGWSYSQDAE